MRAAALLLFALPLSLCASLPARADVTPPAKTTGDADIAARLRAAVAANPDVRLDIAADKRVAYGTVIRAMDLAKQAGVTKMSFSVAP